jgi:hypothetical protein
MPLEKKPHQIVGGNVFHGFTQARQDWYLSRPSMASSYELNQDNFDSLFTTRPYVWVHNHTILGFVW